VTAEQLDLLTLPVTRGTHRQRDPWTSIAAARAKDPGPDQAAILEHLRHIGGRGTVDDACTALPNRDRGCVSRRLTDLAVAGYITDSGTTVVGSRGRHVIVWAVVS
jgi:hypothetical protein